MSENNMKNACYNFQSQRGQFLFSPTNSLKPKDREKQQKDSQRSYQIHKVFML